MKKLVVWKKIGKDSYTESCLCNPLQWFATIWSWKEFFIYCESHHIITARVLMGPELVRRVALFLKDTLQSGLMNTQWPFEIARRPQFESLVVNLVISVWSLPFSFNFLNIALLVSGTSINVFLCHLRRPSTFYRHTRQWRLKIFSFCVKGRVCQCVGVILQLLKSMAKLLLISVAVRSGYL